MATAIAEPPHLTADLRALYLSTVASQWRPLAEQAARQRQAPADYLAQLVHLEVTGRRERRIQRRIQDARFPMLKTLDAFSFEAQPDLDRDAVLQVFDCRFVAEAANIVFVGGVGTGKTHLSIALGMACCQHDYRVRFVTAAELVTLLVEAQQQGRLARKLAQLARFDLVICDELGYVPLDKAGADLLFGFILGCAPRFEPRSGGPAGVSTRCAPPPLRYGPAGDTPSVPPLRQQLWALRPGLDEGVPAVHDVSREATERRRPAGTAGSRFESVAAGMAGSRRWATRAPPRSDEAGLMC